jgi:hypothetical protein
MPKIKKENVDKKTTLVIRPRIGSGDRDRGSRYKLPFPQLPKYDLLNLGAKLGT